MDKSIVENVVAQLDSGLSCSLIGLEGMGQGEYAERITAEIDNAVLVDVQMFPYLSGEDFLRALYSQLKTLSRQDSEKDILNEQVIELVQLISTDNRLVVVINGLTKLSNEPTSLFNYLAGLVRFSNSNLSFCFVDNSSIFHELPVEKSGNLSQYIFSKVEYSGLSKDSILLNSDSQLSDPAVRAVVYDIVSSLSEAQKEMLINMGGLGEIDQLFIDIELVQGKKVMIPLIVEYLTDGISSDSHELLSIKAGELYIMGKKKEIDLTTAEIDLLETFIKRNGEVITKDEIAEVIWGEESSDKYSEWAISQYVFRIRKKLQSVGVDAIKSVRGKGYKLVC